MIIKNVKRFFSLLLAMCVAVYALTAPATALAATQQLTVTAPTFTAVAEGYTQPAAKPITIKNTGEAWITSISISIDSDNFLLKKPEGNIILAPDVSTNDKEYTIQPKAGLPMGEYTAVITVEYGSGQTATATVSFTVKEAGEEWQPPTLGVPDKNAPQTLAELRTADPAEVAKISRFDSRNYGIVPPVKDQGYSNICWCYAAINASETSILRSGIDPTATTDNLRLSPEVLAQARHNRGADPLGNTKGETTGKDWYTASGDVSYTAPLLSQWCGPVRAGETADNAFEKPAYRLENAMHIYKDDNNNTANREMMKRAIAQYGAITASYNNMQEHEYYNPKNVNGSSPHACTIIGWDDNIPAEKFQPGGATQNGGWLVKNSYKSLPYFWLSYDSGISLAAWAFTYAPTDKYDFNYFYDSAVEDFSLRITGTAANIFEAKKGTEDLQEQLTAVSVGLQDRNSTCTVEVYTDLKDETDPTGGTLAATGSASYEHSGIYTIPLDKSVTLQTGSKFAVVAKTSASNGSAYIRMTLNTSNSNSYQFKNGYWSKCSYTPRIKAFTKLSEKQEPAPPDPPDPPIPEPTPESTPNLVIDYANEVLTGLNPGSIYKINNESFKADSETLPIQENWLGTTLSIIRAGNGADTADSAVQTIHIPARPAAPALSAKNETAAGKADGQILGVTAAMEYQNYGGNTWQTCTASPLINLAAGTYNVRLKATANSFAGTAQILIIATNSATPPSGGGGSGGGSSSTKPSEPAKPVNPPDTKPNPPIVQPIEQIFIDITADSWYHDAVQAVYDRGLLRGTDETHFSPDFNTTRSMVATLLYRLADEPATDNISNIFKDVSDGRYYTAAVKWSAEQKILTGYENQLFLPDNNITREEFAAMLWRYAGSPVPQNSVAGYRDMPASDSWSAAALRWAVETGILQGRASDILAPRDYASRAEISAMVMRFVEFTDSK